MERRVKVGLLVRDADGKRLGRVARCDATAFEVVRRLWSPYEWVIGYDEVLDVADGVVKVSRSDDALFELAEGGLPHAWRQVRPPEAERALPATPSESSAGLSTALEATSDLHG
jgi:hypothetical protein